MRSLKNFRPSQTAVLNVRSQNTGRTMPTMKKSATMYQPSMARNVLQAGG